MLKLDKKIKSSEFIQRTESAVDVAYAVQISELKSIAIDKMEKLNEKDLGQFIKIAPIVEATKLAVNFFVESYSYKSSYSNFSNLILPLHSVLSLDQIKQILDAFAKNNQIYPSAGIPELYLELYKLTSAFSVNLKEDWRKVYQQLDENGYETELLALLEAAFPDFESTYLLEK